MSIQTTDHGAHLVHLGTERGVGALVLPDPATEIQAPEPTLSTVPGQKGRLIPHESLHSASWRAAMTRLDGLGWALLQGEEEDTTPLDHLGRPSHQLGWTDDRRTVLALNGLEGPRSRLAELEVRLVGLALELSLAVRWKQR